MSDGPDERRPLVVLIPGWLDTPGLFRRMAARLEAAGLDTAIFALRPSTGRRSIEDLAGDLRRWVERSVPAGRPIDIVGFSMGGLVGRWYVQRLGGAGRVRRLIAISVPNNGTMAAWLLPTRLLRLPGVREMRPGSALLEELNADTGALDAVDYAGIRGGVDNMIVPPSSCDLGVGEEHLIRVPWHGWMPRSRRVIGKVLELLSPAEPG